jgi:CBS domain-containing protein
VIGLLCLGLALGMGWELAAGPQSPPLAVLVWLGYINLSLAAFNMMPAYPLDGGRVLRAGLWWATGSQTRATRWAARVGQLSALGLIAFGLVRFFGGAGLGGLWIAFIGWFLLRAAGASQGQVELAEGLRGIRVSDLMARDCVLVDARSNLQQFVHEHLLRGGQRCFVVLEQGAVAGLVTSQEVRSVPRARWPYTTLDEVMRPLEQLCSVEPDTPASDSLETMGRDDVHQLPVVANGRLEGVISRGSILQFLRTREELNL